MLSQQEGVLGAVAVAHGDILVAYVTPRDVDIAAITERSRKIMPTYMVPSIIIPMDVFPLTVTGKVDRQALPPPESSSVEFSAPSTPEEASMCAVWEALFGLDCVGIHDDFFALGGHSLLAMQLAQQASYSVSTIMANSTVAQLVRAESLFSGRKIPIARETMHMSRTEKRMLYIHLQDPSSTNYHVPFKIRFDEEIDVENNLRQLIASEPILRTRFVNGKAISDVDVCIEEDCDIWAPFDLPKGPLCRFSVQDNVLAGCAHHSIFDGRSLQLLMQRIADPIMSKPQRSVRDYAAWEAEEPVDLDGWKSILCDAPPRFECSGPEQTYRSMVVLDASRVKRIVAWCGEHRVTPFVFAMYVTRYVLWAYSHESFALGVAYDTRPTECQDAMGMFVNTLLVPFGKLGETIDELQARWVHEILPKARTPYDEVVKLGYGCNVYLAFNVGVDRAVQGAHLVPLDDEVVPDAKFDLSLEWLADEVLGGWSVQIESGIGSWHRLEERLLRALDAALSGNEDPSTPLPDEFVECLRWGRGVTVPIPDLCLHELFEAQAKKTPDAVALLCNHEEMTYRELDARSTSLAVHLQSLGVKPDIMVGLMLDRSFDLIVGMLGILKAGGCYVPLDPEYPEERLRFLVEDSEMKVLVTHCIYKRDDVHVCVCMDTFGFSVETELLDREVRPTDLAYMIYTSGSTGRPKGVEVAHRNIVNFVQHFCHFVLQSDVSALILNVVFDLSISVIFPTLLSGATLSLNDENGTFVVLTPSYLSKNDMIGRRLTIAGGENVPDPLICKYPDLINVYGRRRRQQQQQQVKAYQESSEETKEKRSWQKSDT